MTPALLALCTFIPQHDAIDARVIDPQGAFLSATGTIIVAGKKDKLVIIIERQTSDGSQQSQETVDVPGIMVGMRRGPRVAVAGENVVVTYSQQTPGQKFRADEWAIASRDEGRTWSERVRVNDAEGCAPEGLNGLCAFGESKFATVWLDLRGEHMEIWSSVSTDGGKSWGKNFKVYNSPSGNVCECCHPSVAADGAGGFRVMWRNSLDGNRDMYLATTKDGKEFTAAAQLGTGHWKLNACPMDGGAISAGPNSRTVWRREKTIYLCRPGEAETPLGPGEQPTVTITDKGVWVAWLSKRNGELMVLRPGATSPELLAQQADDPVLFSGPSGEVGLVWTAAKSIGFRRLVD